MKCSVCKRVRNNTHRDVIEIDCATNGKVEDVRDLISERMRVAPEGELRVIVMDEAHKLTDQAQNALLKTMEEPPPFIIFCVCSSEPHKIIPTIRNRCQKHALTKVSDASMLGILHNVVEKEGVDVEEAALELIVQEAGGSAREALVILELVSVIGITEENVRDVLLRSPKSVAYDLLKSISEANRGQAFRIVETAQKEGRDMLSLLEECAKILMTIARYMVDKTKDHSKADKQLLEIARMYKAGQLVHITQSLIETTTKIRQNVPADLAVQVGILKTISLMEKSREATKV